MVLFVILIIVFSAVAIIYGICSATTDSESKNVVETPKEEPRVLTDAENEAIRQAEEAFDYDTRRAVINGTYDGPLPDYDGVYWSSIYPDLYHTKIAGINFARGIKNLAGTCFDAQLVADPKNKYDQHAIEIIHAEGYKHLGYIPADETSAVREFLNNQLPYPCRAHIVEKYDYDDRPFLVGEINIKRPNVSPQ